MAALIYQHASREADKSTAGHLDAALADTSRTSTTRTAGVRVSVRLMAR